MLLRSKSALAALVRFGRSERVDIALAAIRLWGLGIAMPALFSLGLTAVIPRFLALHRPGWGSVSAITQNPVLQLLVYSMIVDFLRYWLHRWMHESTVLWRFHRLRHSAESFTVLTGNRQHPVEDILAVPVVVLPLTLLGATPVQVVLVIFIRTILDMAQHSMVPFSYGWFGRWLFYSPTGHRVHHSPLPEHWDSNYGDFSPLWDHLFGTWYGGDVLNETVGLADAGPARTLSAEIFRPFVEVGEHLRRRGRLRSPTGASTLPP